MEKLLDRSPVMQMEARRLEDSLSSSIGSMVISSETSPSNTEVPPEVKSEVEQTRYGEVVIAGLQLNGDAKGHNLLGEVLKNMGMPHAQKGRRNNVDTAVKKLATLDILTIPENGHLRKGGEVKLTALGRAYEVNPEIIEEIKTSSDDQNT